MPVFKTKNYYKNVLQLNKTEQNLLSLQEELLAKDMFHPKLHTKKLKGFGADSVYSFRITRSHRAIFRLNDGSIILFAIGHRKDIYQRI